MLEENPEGYRLEERTLMRLYAPVYYLEKLGVFMELGQISKKTKISGCYQHLVGSGFHGI